MPSLRKLLQHVTTCYKAFGESFCALVEAVGVVEEKETLLAEANATIERLRTRLERERDQGLVVVTRLREQRNVAETQLAEAKAGARLVKACDEAMGISGNQHSELAEAKAEIESLRKQRDGWEEGCWQAEQELAKAKAEIERLSRELDILLNTADHLHKRYKKALHDRDQAEAELETKNTDAEIGRMVRRMPANTGLKHYSNGTWYAMRYCRDVGWCTIRVDFGTHNPAEALRSIQEVGDAEG